MILTRLLTALPVLTLLAAASSVPAQAWTNSGGNAQRNGLTDAFGPVTAQLAWSSGPSSVIAWNPVIADGLLFVVRQTGGAHHALRLGHGAEIHGGAHGQTDPGADRRPQPTGGCGCAAGS